MLRPAFTLRALSAALCVSTALVGPAFAQTVTIPADPPLMSTQTFGAVDTFTSAADVTATGGSGFEFTGDVGTAVNTGTVDAANAAFDFGGTLGSFTNQGTLKSANRGILVRGDAGTIVNKGGIQAAVGVVVSNRVDSLRNDGTIDVTSNAIEFLGPVGTFSNAGSITSAQMGVSFTHDAGSIENTGTIEAKNAIYVGGTVDSFFNGGSILGEDSGLRFDTVGDFTNAHIIRATSGSAVSVGDVTSFTNRTGALIEAASGFTAVSVWNYTGAFSNAGTIRGGTGVSAYYEIDSFFNSGLIEATDGIGVVASSGIGNFHNAHGGIIRSVSASVVSSGDVQSFTNEGTISSSMGYSVEIAGDIGSFTNSGTIFGAYRAIDIDGSGGSFINSGTIKSGTDSAVNASNPLATFRNSGTIESLGNEALQLGVVGSFFNSGTIRGGLTAVHIAGAGSFENTGTISGSIGLSAFSGSGIRIVNSGTIEGTDGTAIALGLWGSGHDDVLELRTGSRILGGVEFAGGNDTLDVSGFQGNTILTVASLESVTTGTRLVNTQLDGSGSGTVSIIDGTGITGGGTAALGEVAGAIGGEIAGALGGISVTSGGPEPLGYAPARPQGAAEAATDELAAVADPNGPEVWGKAFGGVIGKTNEYGAVLGGVVAGSHVAVDSTTRLGGVVSVSGARFATNGDGQVVTGTIGSLGLYGSTDLGSLALSYSVLGGVAANHSDRTVTALVTETARADFSSWYWSPEIGVSIPVPLLDGVDTDAGFKLRYIGGGVGGYTEAGSSQNLTVGTSALNLLDARAELTAKLAVASTDHGDVTLSGTGGVMALHNFGSSVSIAGFPLATTAAGTALGVYGDVTLDAPVGPSAKASASAGVEVRTDAVSSASVNLGLSAGF